MNWHAVKLKDSTLYSVMLHSGFSSVVGCFITVDHKVSRSCNRVSDVCGTWFFHAFKTKQDIVADVPIYFKNIKGPQIH